MNSNHKILGLNDLEVKQSRHKHGFNEIVSSKTESLFDELRHVFLDPMGLMLLGLALLYYLIGDTTDAIILLIAYIPVTLVDVFLELRAQKALSALKSTFNPIAKVYRNDQIKEIPIRELVPGDYLIFEEGQSLPADGEIFEAVDLSINESALTGESIPISKMNKSRFYAGTQILAGRGIGIIDKIGQQTDFGKISHLLENTQSEQTPLQKKINQIVNKVILLAAVLVVVLFLLQLNRGLSVIPALISALTFGMAAVPEEFPLVFTLYLSFGAWRLSRHGVLVKSLPSVETLGNVDVICTDKTGTLTEGKFQLTEKITFHPYQDEEVWKIAMMACETSVVDLMEIAIHDKAKPFANQLNDWKLHTDYPFESNQKYMSHIWQNSLNEKLIAMKGSIEGVLAHCLTSDEERKSITDKANLYSSQGKRLLGLASKKLDILGDRMANESNLNFIAILVFNDPIRKSAKDAIRECQTSGIEVKMMTGDHPYTAHAVADELGLLHSHHHLYTGHQLNSLSHIEREKAYEKGAIFSRVTPEQKYEMVAHLKKIGKVVAMTGDGINDTPALKLADIGVSMGENATDAARSSAKMVLMKSDLNGIAKAVFEGRRIFANLRRSFSYLIAFHIPVILLSLIPPLMGYQDLLLPIHIILLELIVHPISAYVFENIKSDQSKQNKTLMSMQSFLLSLFSGILLSILSLSVFVYFQKTNDTNMARSLALVVILIGNIGLVLYECLPAITRRLVMTVLILAILAIVLTTVDPIAKIFHLEKCSVENFILACIAGFISIIPSSLIKKIKHL